MNFHSIDSEKDQYTFDEKSTFRQAAGVLQTPRFYARAAGGMGPRALILAI